MNTGLIKKGREINSSEIEFLTAHLSVSRIIIYLLDVYKKYPLINAVFDIPNNNEDSELLASLRWLTPKEQIEEVQDFYPGIVAVQEGFFPIGECMNDSGNPYFVTLDDKNEAFVVRILHDEIINDKLSSNAVEPVCRLEILIDIISRGKL